MQPGCDKEMMSEWLKMLYELEIEDAKETISNERLWELGYDGDDENPHTYNIIRLENYIKKLRKMIEYVDHPYFDRIEAAERCLVDNGIDADEASTVLQAIGYVLLDEELYGGE